MSAAEFVVTAAIKHAVAGREAEVLEGLGIDWRSGRPHIQCPYRDHADSDPSWRWDDRHRRAHCTCSARDDIFDVAAKIDGGDFDAAKLRIARILHRDDLIKEKSGGGQQYQATDAKSLLEAKSEHRDDRLPIFYLAHRLAVDPSAVPIPATPVLGLKALGYYDPPPQGSKAKPKLVGEFPCAVFFTVAADGKIHAHRIYLAPEGRGKADLGTGPDGRPRNPKKSAKRAEGDSTAGRAALWGAAHIAPHIILTEGVETGAAVALALLDKIEADEIAVAAAITAGGIEAFQPYPVTARVTVAADRDEAPKADGKPGSRRGARAARAFGLKHHERLEVAIALPGNESESVDWLDILLRDGAEAVRAGVLAAVSFEPNEEEIDNANRDAAAAPSIRVMGGDLAAATQSALQVLAAEPDALNAVYVRASLLMVPTRVRERLNANGIRRPMNALILRAASPDWMALRLAQRAAFYKVSEKGTAYAVDPPQRLCRTVLAAAPWEQLPPLTGIIEAPTILPDGTLVDAAGYDPSCGLLFDPGNTHFPAIPARPTRRQAEDALALLRQPIEDFPFLDEASRAVALSAMLTVLIRRTLRAAPLFAFDAPKMASGKTLIATVCSYIATGRGPCLMSQVEDPADERKRLFSALLEGPAIIVIDNVERALRSDSLCIALTEPTFTDRVLGKTENATAQTNCCFFATGNNLVISGDLSARALLSRIDPECERPEEREFTRNLHEWVPEHRGELAAAALTVIRGFLAAGEPKQNLPNFARFEEWQRLCRFPLTWLGCADPCSTRKNIETKDPVRAALKALLSARHDHFKEATTVKDAVKSDEKDAATLHAAMENVAGEKGGINARRLGNFIAKHERRIEGALHFERAGDRQGVALWQVRHGGFGGFRGFTSAPSRKGSNDENHIKPESQYAGTNPRNPPNPRADSDHEDVGEIIL
jgi:hypothetical protein